MEPLLQPLTEKHIHVWYANAVIDTVKDTDMSEEYQYESGDLLSTSEAATFLGISRQRLNILLKDGRIPDAYQMKNKIWVIPYDSLLDLPERKPGNPHDKSE